jgi:hypothetical protein
MASRPVNVDGVRRLLNVAPEDMSDADLRRALAVLACDKDPHGSLAEVAETARRVVDALNRIGGSAPS